MSDGTQSKPPAERLVLVVKAESLQILISDAEGWALELGALNYFISHVLERKKRAGENCSETLDVFSISKTLCLS
jgi:hypothetical protein